MLLEGIDIWVHLTHDKGSNILNDIYNIHLLHVGNNDIAKSIANLGKRRPVQFISLSKNTCAKNAHHDKGPFYQGNVHHWSSIANRRLTSQMCHRPLCTWGKTNFGGQFTFQVTANAFNMRGDSKRREMFINVSQRHLVLHQFVITIYKAQSTMLKRHGFWRATANRMPFNPYPLCTVLHIKHISI